MALGPLQTKEKVSAAPPVHVTAQGTSSAKATCRQKLRNEVPAARNLALSCRLNRSSVTVRVLHVSSMVCSRSISGSLLQWRISGGTTSGTSSFLGKGQQPVLVEPCCGLVSKHARSGALMPETRSFDDKFDAMGAPSAEQGRLAQTCGTSAEFAPEDAERAGQEE